MALLKDINKLTLWDMIQSPELYAVIAEGLVELPVPDRIRIKRKMLSVPKDMDEFSGSIAYGQRLYFDKPEPNDFGIIIRMIVGFYYPIYTGQKWNADELNGFVRVVTGILAKDVYPTAMHLVKLFGEMLEREHKYLYREPTAIEKAAGIEKLNIYSELNALDFLRDSMKITVAEVLQTPYNDCLVRFMNAKEIADFQDKHFKLIQEKNELSKTKFKKK